MAEFQLSGLQTFCGKIGGDFMPFDAIAGPVIHAC
jgi:hypothetical protein